MACCLNVVLGITPISTLTNRILSHLPDQERAALLAEADYTTLPAGHTLAAPGEPVTTAYYVIPREGGNTFNSRRPLFWAASRSSAYSSISDQRPDGAPGRQWQREH